MRDIWVRRASALLVGAALAGVLPESVAPWVLALTLLILIKVWLWQPRDFFGVIKRPEILLLIISLAIGFLYSYSGNLSLPGQKVVDSIQVGGTLLDWNPGSADNSGASGAFKVERVSAAPEVEAGLADIAGKKFHLTVYPGKNNKLPKGWESVRPGDVLTLTARLEYPKPSGTPGGFDLRKYYAARGLSGSLTAKKLVSMVPGNTPLPWVIRQHVQEMLTAWDPKWTGILVGILFGDSSGIPNAMLERYRITGVLHVFAASGSNVAFVLGIFLAVFGFLPKNARSGLTSVALIFYAELCGASAPIMRATVMGVAALLGSLGQGRVSSLRWLLLTGMILFAWNPLLLSDIGFQLSFAATLGIIALTPRFVNLRPFKKIPKAIRLALGTTLAAQASTLPLMVSAFHRLSLIGIVANLFVLFILGSAFELGMIGMLLSFVPVLAAPFFQASLWLIEFTDLILTKLASLPLADVWVIEPGFLFWLAWYGGLAVWLIGWKKVRFIGLVLLRRVKWPLTKAVEFLRRLFPELGWPGFIASTIKASKIKTSDVKISNSKIRGSAFLALVIIVVTVVTVVFPMTDKSLEVTFIDVGQGDSILIRTPEKHALLIDTGPKNEHFDSGERIVFPYLLHLGVKHLDALIVTHEHQDHIGGAAYLLENIPVDWVGVPEVGDRLQNKAWQEGIFQDVSAPSKIQTLRAGDKIALDSGAWLDVLAPSEVLEGTHSDENNNSLVTELHYLGQSVLLSADMEKEEMEEIRASGMTWEGDYFKEPHHGSRFSLDEPWLDRLNPKAVIISVGKNTFGHPSQEILQYWAKRGVPVYRTDQNGTITLRLGKRGSELSLGRQD